MRGSDKFDPLPDMAYIPLPEDPWLRRDYVKLKLMLASKFSKEFSLECFKLSFGALVEDSLIEEVAQELGFEVIDKGTHKVLRMC